MVNQNIRRITVAGRIVRVMESRINGIATYKVGIQKIDSGIWVVNISEDMYFKAGDKEAVFELAMVFEDDDIYGKVDTELSNVEAIYIKGKDISEEEYASQEEMDKSWLITTENLDAIQVDKTKSILTAFGWVILIGIGLTYFAASSWVDDWSRSNGAIGSSTYILGVIAIAYDLGGVALVLMTVNKTASKYFRLLIPISLIVFSVITANICGVVYHIGSFIFTVILIVMLFMRMKNGFGYTGEGKVYIGGYEL